MRDGRLRDATLLVVLAYAGLRPQEALALEWRHVRERTLLVERARLRRAAEGAQEPPPAADRVDCSRRFARISRRGARRAASRRSARRSSRPRRATFWRATDWRNWRKRIYKPVATAVGIDGARPYDLRHAFASLLIHEGRLSVVEIAAQLGHNPTVCLDTYAHVMAEERDGEHDQRRGADRAGARRAETEMPAEEQLSFDELGP